MMAQQNQVNVSIDEEPGGETSPRNIPNLARLDSSGMVSRTTQQLPRSNLGIGDRLNSVFREIRPLVENARMGNNARLSLPTWLPRNPNNPIQNAAEVPAQRPQSSIAHVNLGPGAQTYILSERGSPSHRAANQRLSTSLSNESTLSGHTDEHPDVNISVNPANNNAMSENGDNDSQSDDGNQVVQLRAFLQVIIKYAPFFFILFIKFMYDMREGLFTFFILFCAFIHSNTLVRREHCKQMNRSIGALLSELVFTAGTVAIVHFLFGHEKLLPNVIMFPAYTEPIDIWELLWLVILTDHIVKIITVDVKLLVTATPAVILPFQKRGKVYLFVESVSQLYRSLLTIQPWLFYLMQSYDGSEKMVGMFLTSVYVIAKVVEILMRLRLFKHATWTLLQSVSIGTKPTCEQLTSAGDSCPICHDDYTTPVRLGCSHIFCELCIAAWLDREHTCPLCRAKVADEPFWRDGYTTLDLQLY